MLADVLCHSSMPEGVLEAILCLPVVQANLEVVSASLLAELLHMAADRGNTVGNALFAEERFDHFSTQNFRDCHCSECTPGRLVVVGVVDGRKDLPTVRVGGR